MPSDGQNVQLPWYWQVVLSYYVSTNQECLYSMNPPISSRTVPEISYTFFIFDRSRFTSLSMGLTQNKFTFPYILTEVVVYVVVIYLLCNRGYMYCTYTQINIQSCSPVIHFFIFFFFLLRPRCILYTLIAVPLQRNIILQICLNYVLCV